MRKLCPNLEREDALDTVLEVPIPEEFFASNKHKPWQPFKSWTPGPHAATSRAAELQFLLGVVAAPLIPLPVTSDRTLINDLKNSPIERSMANYIVQQYTAAAGGEHALNSIDSMYAVGKVKMAASEFVAGEDPRQAGNPRALVKSMKQGAGEIGGFVLWQKRPDLWSLELVVSGCKITAGSDGAVAWRQTPWQNSHASRGPPRPLRRSLQGLDPRLISNLFSDAVCMGEKTINGQDCFVLKVEADPSTLRARSSRNVEIIRHTIWGYYNQKTGLLIQLQDTHSLRINAPGNNNNVVCWETTMESLIHDYRTVEGAINIAHSGRTSVSLLRFGETSDRHTRTRMEEIWSIEEVDFNIKGLMMECFLPPGDLERADDEECGAVEAVKGSLSCRGLGNSCRVAKSVTKVVAVEDEDLGVFGSEQRL